ncbi:hypothetical protein KUTeg_024901 [Tegillarca granosa]|uniref:Ionotropic glutamate receptor L-glutamate and glycine-binding domain-containing protein n=1 Tax=Tegillarca granosa TaxID=220873 RepID=A0ABQ9DWN1_TEGGR|nr:hypothetical protein KUTeg_023990 [Tegillarca granosa]KAJ8298370.1 hypothetical protein KUTeg_024901 [Tegillarca granosa]
MGQTKPLEERTLKEEPPFVQKRSTNTSNGESLYEGYAVDLLELIFKKTKNMDFDYELRPRKDKVYGVRGENNSWTGLIGEIINGVSVLLELNS